MSIIKSADQQVIEKPWGKEIIWAATDHYIGKILIINDGCRLSLQYHNEKTETILVISGELNIENENKKEIVKLSIGDSFHIAPKTVHRFCAIGGPVTIIEVSTTQLDDVIRIEDDYGR